MYVVAITGASGPILGIRLIEELLRSGREVSAIVSETAWKIINHEIRGERAHSLLKTILEERKHIENLEKLKEYQSDNLFSPFASGTTKFDAVITVPCSMKTLSAISRGYADTLITRVVDVALKERRRCILVPRETPLNLIHIENMLQAKKAGAEILMPVPGFYTFPQTVDDMINFVIGKILDLLDIDHKLFRRWRESEAD